MKRIPRGLLLAVLAYVALRALVLHLAFDQVSLTNYELYPMGTLPKAILAGADIPLRLYYDNAAGQLVTGLLAVPVYLLLGDGYLALKLVPAACGLGALLCVWFLLDRHISRRAANLGALAFALGPVELVVKYSLLASGNHFENLFYSSLALACFYRLHASEGPSARRWLLATGVATGFSLFVFLGSIIPVGLMLGMHLGLRGWRGSAADLRLGLPALLLGLAPLVVVNLAADARGLGFLGSKFGEQGNQERDWGLVGERVHDFVLVELPRAGVHYSFQEHDVPAEERWDEVAHPFAPRGGWPGERTPSIPVANLVVLSAFLLAWLYALPGALQGCWRIARSLTGGPRARLGELALVPFVLLPPLTALAFGISNLKIDPFPVRLGPAGYRYYLPLFLFCTVLVAAVADRLLDRGRVGRWCGLALLTALFLPSAWNTAWLLDGTPGVGPRYVGYNFIQAARGLFAASADLTHEERIDIVETVPPAMREHMYRGMGELEAQRWVIRVAREQGMGDFEVLRTRALPLDEIVARYPVHARGSVARGAGLGLRYYVGMRGQSDANLRIVVSALQLVAASGSTWAPHLVAGSATSKNFPSPWAEVPKVLTFTRRMMKLLPLELREDFGRGAGEVCGRLLRREIPEETEFLKTYIGSVVALGNWEVLVGVGRGMALATDTPARSEAARGILPDPYWTDYVEVGFAQGLAELEAMPD